jgi:hypothetical protein
MIHAYLRLKKTPLPRKHRSDPSYKKIDQAQLQDDIRNSDMAQRPSDDVSSLVKQYNDTLGQLIEKHAPLKSGVITVRPITPWYNNEIHQAKVHRRKCEDKWRKSKLQVFHDIFITAKNKVTNLIAKAKTAFFSEKVVACGDDQKAMFKVVDEILGRQQKQSLPPLLSLKDTLETFSNFFHTKIITLRRNLDAEGRDATPNPTTVLPIHDPIPGGLLTTFKSLTQDEVAKIIMKSPSKSCSLDPIPTWLLKSILDPLLPTITDIVNLSTQFSTFPPNLKRALVTPILKKRTLDCSILKNYRPVSNLPFISKIIEKAVLAQLSDHMEHHNLYCPVQSAYRPKHSTETALLKITNDVLVALDSGKCVILTLLDLSAAFDTIDHNILISQLRKRIGVEGSALQWFSSYHTDHFQAVSICGETSSDVLLTCGVPQGSVLGPNKFINYSSPTYDIAIRHGVVMHQYADDTQLYVAFDPKDQHQAQARMEACIADIKSWMRANKLQLNEDKTEFLIITPARQADKVEITSIHVGDTVVTASPTAKNLGATFDNTMTQNAHVTALVKSCNYQLRLIGQARRYLTHNATEKVIHAFVSSRLDSGNALLNGLPDYQIGRVQRVQNTAARILTRTRKFEHISPILRSLHWLPVVRRIYFKVLCLTYKCLHNQAPKYMSDLLTPYHPTRELRSSDQLLLTVPKSRTKTYGDRSFASTAPLLWNALPFELRASCSLDAFKLSLKTYLFRES